MTSTVYSLQLPSVQYLFKQLIYPDGALVPIFQIIPFGKRATGPGLLPVGGMECETSTASTLKIRGCRFKKSWGYRDTGYLFVSKPGYPKTLLLIFVDHVHSSPKSRNWWQGTSTPSSREVAEATKRDGSWAFSSWCPESPIIGQSIIQSIGNLGIIIYNLYNPL